MVPHHEEPLADTPVIKLRVRFLFSLLFHASFSHVSAATFFIPLGAGFVFSLFSLSSSFHLLDELSQKITLTCPPIVLYEVEAPLCHFLSFCVFPIVSADTTQAGS